MRALGPPLGLALVPAPVLPRDVAHRTRVGWHLGRRLAERRMAQRQGSHLGCPKGPEGGGPRWGSFGSSSNDHGNQFPKRSSSAFPPSPPHDGLYVWLYGPCIKSAQALMPSPSISLLLLPQRGSHDGSHRKKISFNANSGVCWLFIFKVTEPSSIPYRTPPACAKRAAYPDPHMDSHALVVDMMQGVAAKVLSSPNPTHRLGGHLMRAETRERNHQRTPGHNALLHPNVCIACPRVLDSRPVVGDIHVLSPSTGHSFRE
jgi:hypothetical protein